MPTRSTARRASVFIARFSECSGHGIADHVINLASFCHIVMPHMHLIQTQKHWYNYAPVVFPFSAICRNVYNICPHFNYTLCTSNGKR